MPTVAPTDHSTTLLIIVAVVLGTLVFMVLLFAAIYFGLKKANEAVIARFEREGVQARVGDGLVTVIARDYRSSSRYAGGLYKKNPGELLLTPSGLHAVGVRLERGTGSYDLGPDDLKACRAWLADGWVHVLTQSPPGATGEVELRTRAETGGQEFLDRLRARGVQIGPRA